MMDFILIAVILLIVAAAAGYVIKAKKAEPSASAARWKGAAAPTISPIPAPAARLRRCGQFPPQRASK